MVVPGIEGGLLWVTLILLAVIVAILVVVFRQ
jgi:hypothetical protein